MYLEKIIILKLLIIINYFYYYSESVWSSSHADTNIKGAVSLGF